MHRTLRMILATAMATILGCSEDHVLPAKFHDDRIGTPEQLSAEYVGEDVVLEWNISTPAEVLYYIVTLSEGSSGAEWKYTAPGDEQSITVEFAWTDSVYIFHVEAVDATAFVGESSNADTVLIPQ
jgi:hypothetical protein